MDRPDSPARRAMRRYLKVAGVALAVALLPLLALYVRTADAMLLVFWFSLAGVAVVGFVLLALYLLVAARGGDA